jgi:hypothetical protein
MEYSISWTLQATWEQAVSSNTVTSFVNMLMIALGGGIKVIEFDSNVVH